MGMALWNSCLILLALVSRWLLLSLHVFANTRLHHGVQPANALLGALRRVDLVAFLEVE